MKKKNKRLVTILILMAFFAFGCAILLFNLRENLIFFYSPTEVFEKQIETTQMIRVGGMVKNESLVKNVGKFEAKTVLAKHDENYMPPEIEDIKSIKDERI